MTRIVLLSLLVALVPGVASASEESQALAARAAIEIDAGRVGDGMALLDRAVAADPYDAGVRYQRGVLRAKQHDIDDALEDLRAAVAYRPDFSEAELELGAALIEAGAPRDAVAPLLKAQRDAKLEGAASFFLGVAHLRLGELDEARQSFDRARARDASLAVAIQYYQGVIDYRQGDLAAADDRFRDVERDAPESALGREASQFIEVISQSRRTTYHAFAKLGLEYDSNVTLAPDNTVPGGISGQGDGRVVLNAGGWYVPWSNGLARFSMGYEFFQSLQFNLTDYDLQDHRPSLELTFERGHLSGGLLGRYDYYLRSTNSFLQEVTAFPWLSWREEGFGRTEIYYRMQRRDYKQLSFAVLDGFYYQAGARQFVELGSATRQLWCGYQFETSVPVDKGSDLFEYDAQRVETGIEWELPYAVRLETGYRYSHKDYNNASAVFVPVGRRRRDHDHRVVVAFERPLVEISEHLFVTASYFGTFNNSNKDDFQYDRQIGSIGVEVRL